MKAADATLGYLQDELEAIYGVEAPRIAAFLVGRTEASEAGRAPRSSEELLVIEEEEGLAVGLFLDDGVLAAATLAEPHHKRPKLVKRAAFGRLACAAEGVSHFVYLASRVAEGRTVSLIELEVQAEVDKFVFFLLHLWRRGMRRASRTLRARLFEGVRYRAHLAIDEADRYREANRLGKGYARFLEGRYVEEADIDGLLRELRQSYRMSGGEKLGYLGARSVH